MIEIVKYDSIKLYNIFQTKYTGDIDFFVKDALQLRYFDQIFKFKKIGHGNEKIVYQHESFVYKKVKVTDNNIDELLYRECILNEIFQSCYDEQCVGYVEDDGICLIYQQKFVQQKEIEMEHILLSFFKEHDFYILKNELNLYQIINSLKEKNKDFLLNNNDIFHELFKKKIDNKYNYCFYSPKYNLFIWDISNKNVTYLDGKIFIYDCMIYQIK